MVNVNAIASQFAITISKVSVKKIVTVDKIDHTFCRKGYLPGENNQLVDYLSRPGSLQDKFKLPRLKVHLLITCLSATSEKLQLIQQATHNGDMMAVLKYTITHGWHQTVQELPKELQAYWTFREEMIVEDGLILKATWIVIPPSMREQKIWQLHDGHLGSTKWYNWVKQSVYWPNLRKELEDLVLNCQLCLKHSQAKHKPKPPPRSDLPMSLAAK